ncbi:MAG TPA: plastocyanin/azurin family copper-binding protein [Solirubrobacterales bacterium]
MKKVVPLLVLALAAAALVACGGDDDGTTTTETGPAAEGGAAAGGAEAEGEGGAAEAASTLEFEADPGGQLAYTTDEATAKAGQVEIKFNNPASVPHDVAIESADGEQVGKTEIITDSETSTTVELKAGEYTFYCTVPGHREAGMEGTLTVE